MTTKHQYTQVEAWTSLPDSYYLYEADCGLPRAQCGATIPFSIYTSRYKVTVAPRESEYLYVEDGV